MRIVQVANLVTPTSGGIRTTVAALGEGYRAAGHRTVELVAGDRDEEHRLPAGGHRRTLRGTPLPGGAGYRVLTGRGQVRAALTALAPDAIEVHDRFTLAWVTRWAADRGLPATLVVHERLAAVLRAWTPLGPVGDGLARLADHRLLAGVDHVVVASRYAAAAFPAGDPRVTVVPFGVDLARFSPTLRRRPTGGPARLVVVGRLSREKRPELAIEAVRVLRRLGVGVTLDVLGDGPLSDALERRATGLPVRFRGHVGPDRFARLLAQADVLLAPCPVETYGLAALEALASGVPVVVPDAGALPELLGEAPPEAGRVVRGSAATFARAALDLLSVPQARRSAAARWVAERRPWAGAVEHLLAAHEGRPRPLALVR